MKWITTIAVLVALSGCASSDAQHETESTAGLVPIIQSPMTVDQFTAEIRSGKTLQDLRARLGVPIMSSMTVHYMLADGTVSQRMRKSELIIRRKGSDKEEIIQQTPAGDVLKAAPEE